MNADTSQIVMPPDGRQDTFAERIEELAKGLPPMKRRTAAKLYYGLAIHWLGFHTYVRHMRYDNSSNKLVNVGRVCMFCSRGLSGQDPGS